MWQLMVLLVMLARVPDAIGVPRWAIMNTFPIPMPVMFNAQVFPRFFATNRSLGVAYLPLDVQISPMMTNNSYGLAGSLCFTLITSLDVKTPCINLLNQSAAWQGEASWGTGNKDISANASVIFGWWPARSDGELESPDQPKLAPFCAGSMADDLYFPWTGCQARDSSWVADRHFTFSPLISNFYNASFGGYNFTHFAPVNTFITEGLSSWVSSAISYFKEWVGVGLFGILLCFGLVFTLWLLCKLRRQRNNDKVVIAQALAALEQGNSAAVWIAIIEGRHRSRSQF